jgi:S1-C subfamily serine protease
MRHRCAIAIAFIFLALAYLHPAFRPVGGAAGRLYARATVAIDLLEQFSDAVAARAAAVQGAVAAIRLSEGRYLSATLWGPNAAVASEQSLPRGDEFELVVAGGAVAKAKLAGRDPGTNIAVLRLEQPIDFPGFENAEARAGALALAFGADGAGGVRARLGVVNVAGPEWTSSAGGRIDRYIVLDLSLARAEEGGPVLDAKGARLGMSTFGPRRWFAQLRQLLPRWRTLKSSSKDARAAARAFASRPTGSSSPTATWCTARAPSAQASPTAFRATRT